MKYYSLLILIIISLIGIIVNNDSPYHHHKTYSFMSHSDFFLPMNDKPRESELIIEDAKMSNYLSHLVPVLIGEPTQIINLKLSTAFCGIWVYNKLSLAKGFSSHISNTFKLTDLPGSISRFNGIIVKDTITFLNHYTFENHPFIFINHSTVDLKNYDGSIGLGYKCINNNEVGEDIIEKCAKQHLFYKSKVFWLRLNHDNTGTFAIGYYPSEIQTAPKLYRTIDLIDNRNDAQWAFIIHSLFLSDNSFFPINGVMSFGIDGNMLSVSQTVFNWLIEKYFKQDISNGKCIISKEETIELYCEENYDYHNTFPSVLSFVVGKWTLKISIKNLFQKIEKNNAIKTWFAIITLPKKDEFYMSQKMVGITMVVYDKEKKQIGFYPYK